MKYRSFYLFHTGTLHTEFESNSFSKIVRDSLDQNKRYLTCRITPMSNIPSLFIIENAGGMLRVWF